MPFASPIHFTLVADTEKVFNLNRNCDVVRIVVYANPAAVFFNTKNVTVPAMAQSQDGHHVIPAVVTVVDIEDETLGANTVVRMRSAGTPTVMVTGW